MPANGQMTRVTYRKDNRPCKRFTSRATRVRVQRRPKARTFPGTRRRPWPRQPKAANRMNDSIPPADDNGNDVEAIGLALYYSRIRYEFIPLMGREEHAEFAAIIDAGVTEAEAEQWLNDCDDMLGCAVAECFGMGEPCAKCGAGHCHRHPHTD